MAEISGLSKKEIQEEYEDLVFRKVMAIYVQKEGKQILSEIEEEKKNDDTVVDSKAIVKLYDKKERKENLNILWKYSKKLINFAAMIVFVAIVSLSSVVVAFADVREAVVDIIYHLVYEENERYTQVGIGESTGFIDPEVYSWEGAYAPTYMPDGFVLTETYLEEPLNAVVYYNDQNYIFINQMDKSYNMQIDTENASTKIIHLHNSEGLLIVKDGLTTITWSEGEILFEISGTVNTDEIILIAENMRKIR